MGSRRVRRITCDESRAAPLYRWDWGAKCNAMSGKKHWAYPFGFPWANKRHGLSLFSTQHTYATQVLLTALLLKRISRSAIFHPQTRITSTDMKDKIFGNQNPPLLSNNHESGHEASRQKVVFPALLSASMVQRRLPSQPPPSKTSSRLPKGK